MTEVIAITSAEPVQLWRGEAQQRNGLFDLRYDAEYNTDYLGTLANYSCPAVTCPNFLSVSSLDEWKGIKKAWEKAEVPLPAVAVSPR